MNASPFRLQTPEPPGAPRVLFARLKSAQPWVQSAPPVERALAAWPLGRCMGVFMGLFGLDNHELLVLLSVHEPSHRTIDDPTVATWHKAMRACLPSDVEIIELLTLRATIRPATDAPFTRAGIHVFRFFTLPFSRMDEAVALSSAGWETFERDDDPNAGESYRTEPMGLFAQEVPGGGGGGSNGGSSTLPSDIQSDGLTGQGQLLLVTWYDSMTSWERSRTPNPQATINFRRRAALTSSIVAYATRLANTA